MRKVKRKAVRELRPAENNADTPESAVSAGLEAWHQVYEGFSDEEIAEVEAIALNRSRFSREQR